MSTNNFKKISSVTEFLESIGGAVQLAAFLGKHQQTIIYWEKRGIPVKYWPTITKKYGISAETLFKICVKAGRWSDKRPAK